MPVKANQTTTTPKPKTYAFATIEAACDKVHESILTDMKDSLFLDAMDLACKLFIKRMKEELK